jgi:hypothetical protein
MGICTLFALMLLPAPGAAVARGTPTPTPSRPGHKPQAAQSTNVSDAAYTLLNARTTANQQNFFVYQDQDSGFNHGYPSGLFASSQANLATIRTDAGCVYDAAAAASCGTSTSAMDRSRGTVFRISFAAQTPGNFAGVNFEEPEKWGALQSGTGYDLRGATAISLDVLSPDAASVQFGVGSCVTPYTGPLSSAWTTMTVTLGSLSCAPDLSNVHVLFSVATNDQHAPNGAEVLLDNVQFIPVPTSRQAALGFPVANQTFGVVPQQAVPIPSDQVLRSLTTTYEASLTLIALIARGSPQDLATARLIANALDYALHHDSHGDALPAAANGGLGLHNGYEDGDLALFNNQAPPKQGQTGDARLAGFTAALCAPSNFCLVEDGATGGNNAFAILALVQAYQQFGDSHYLTDAATIANWIVGNLTDTTGTGYGGYFSGYADGGVPPPKPLQTGKSTENNADIFAAFSALAQAESQQGNFTAAATWTTAADVAGDFVMQMFDSGNGRFNAGTVRVGTAPNPSVGICPTGSQQGSDVINVCDFLDADTFTTLAMAGTLRYRLQIDWNRPVQYAADTFAQTVTAGGTTFHGFDVVKSPSAGPYGIAWEFTGQVVEAMRYVDAQHVDTRFESAADQYLGQMAATQTSAPFADGSGLVAATMQNGDTLAPAQQCLQTPFQCIPERVGLAATAWAILAEQNVNVFYSAPPPPLIAPIAPPVRLVDTRMSGGPILAGTSGCFQVAGVAGIPSNAAAVVLNVTAVGQTTNGWLTVYPIGPSVPSTSTLNFGPDEYALANGTIMPVGGNGVVCVQVGTVNNIPGSAHVILDATGWMPVDTPMPPLLPPPLQLLSPVRLADTRTSGGPITTGASRCFQVTGLMGIPSDTVAVMLNVTAVGYGTRGWLTAYPSGQSVPNTSTLNFDPSEYALANNAIVRVGSGGQVCVAVGTVGSAPGGSQVVIDATGYVVPLDAPQLPMLSAPQRAVDTRVSGGPITTGTSRCFTLAGQLGIPFNAAGVVVNVTAVGYATAGWLTLYPPGQSPPPTTSTVNFDTSEYAMANGVVIGLGTGGQVCVAVGTVNSAPGSSQVIVDVVGYLP